jgi:hypothetical protein
MKRSLLPVAAALAVAVAASLLATSAGASDDPWQAVKAATAGYHSYDQALKDGYSIAGEPCVAEPGLGAMGIHAVNRTLTMDPAIDPLRPELLLYVPHQNGKLKLVGVEYFQVALANTASGPAPWFGVPNDPTDPNRDPNAPPPDGFFSSAPSVLGQTFDGPMPGHNPFMPWHYDLHVWLWADNPSGLFAPFNPALSCP